MLTKRIIPCLDVKDGRVVKGVNFVDLGDKGDPAEHARRYDEEGADEITLLDITATHEGRRAMLDVVARTAEATFTPLTVGGGIQTRGGRRGPPRGRRRQGQPQLRCGRASPSSSSAAPSAGDPRPSSSHDAT